MHGAVIGDREDELLYQVVTSRWYTAGPMCGKLEQALREFTGKREVILTNSGSSANLLALSCLTSPELGEGAIKPGDEVITTALGFPTTLNPILQIGAIPVFVDIDLPAMTPNYAQMEQALSNKTRAVIFAHTLGYPFDGERVRRFCADNRLWFIEDACDALGSPGTMCGDITTLSFYPAHHITTGEGGALLTNPALGKLARSFRDWGKSCWCLPGHDDTCGRRFAGEIDHKYQFNHIGYNLKMSDLHAAIGVAQMERLPEFIQKRQLNHRYLWRRLNAIPNIWDYFGRPPDADVSWFGFCLICTPATDRNAVTKYLEARNIQTRIVFGGNLLRQPAYRQMVARQDFWPYVNSDVVHYQAFWVGCWPGLTIEHLDYIVECVSDYVREQESK